MQRSRLFLCAVLLAGLSPSVCSAQPVMRAHYINVGQGAATLLEFPCGSVLIDTGAQDEQHVDYLGHYLATFFRDRPHLNNTLSSLIITHPHVDHTRGIRRVSEVCRIAHYVDNGITSGSGRDGVRWIRDQVNSGMLMTQIREVSNDEITNLPHRHGLSDGAIDPVSCADCDPQIVILSGSQRQTPGWSSHEFDNGNNHSLVIRVDFGESSFLFTGDMELPALQTMLSHYRNTDMLNVDVYQVGHHGSFNGTSRALLEAATPQIAVIGVGHWTYGRSGGQFTTYAYGHPRRVLIDLLAEMMPGNRSQPKQVMIFDAVRSSRSFTMRDRIYATGWDGNVVVRADLGGSMRVTVTEARPDRFARRSLMAAAADSVVDDTQPFDSVSPESQAIVSEAPAAVAFDTRRLSASVAPPTTARAGLSSPRPCAPVAPRCRCRVPCCP